jgi:hypothetical protein
MSLTFSQLRKINREAENFFAASSACFVLSCMTSLFIPNSRRRFFYFVEPEVIINLSGAVALASLCTTVVTLLGFLLTNHIAWKREGRDGIQFELDLQKKQLEIEKIRVDLAVTRSNNALE